MKNKFLSRVSVLLVYTLLAKVSYAHGLDIDAIATAGSGCKEGTVVKSLEVLPSGALKVDIEFSEYNVLVGFGNTLERKNCSLALPISLGSSERLKVSQLILRADGIIAPESKTNIKAEVFTAGSEGNVIGRQIIPDRELQGRFKLRARDVLETECGVDTNLRVNSSVLLNSQGTGLESGLSVASMTLVLVAESCN